MLSIIVPIYNEEQYIDELVRSLIASDEISKEIILVDGGSTDGTLNKIKLLQKEYSLLKLVTNPDKYVSKGFNKAFKIVSGSYISLLGAHALYPSNFFNIGISYLEKDEADAVGGPLIQKGRTDVGQSIAYCMSNKFGVGGTEFRTETKKMYVDSVAFAIYKKKIFEKLGLLDESLIRNQDDELHYRMNSYGFRILMVPEMACIYFVRTSIQKLYTQYFGYGLYKPLVFKKVKKAIRPRHIIPVLFVLYIIALPVGFYFLIYLVPLFIYILCAIYFSFVNDLRLKQKCYCFLIFPTLHFAYGSGFLLGLRKLFN